MLYAIVEFYVNQVWLRCPHKSFSNSIHLLSKMDFIYNNDLKYCTGNEFPNIFRYLSIRISTTLPQSLLRLFHYVKRNWIWLSLIGCETSCSCILLNFVSFSRFHCIFLIKSVAGTDVRQRENRNTISYEFLMEDNRDIFTSTRE